MVALSLYLRLQAARDPLAVIRLLVIAALKMPVPMVSKIRGRRAVKLALKMVARAARGNRVVLMAASMEVRPPEPEAQLVAARPVAMTLLLTFPPVAVR